MATSGQFQMAIDSQAGTSFCVHSASRSLTCQRITTENTDLKQRVRQLTADNRTLDERLNAARSNLRFQDRRIADLEAQLTEFANPTASVIRSLSFPTSKP